jgi:predicted transcriptional regulator
MFSSHGSLENKILSTLWKLEENFQENISVGDVQSKINENNDLGWAYTTIKTVMDRLVDKNLIKRIKQNKKYCYRSVLSRTEFGNELLKRITKEYFDNNIELLLKTAKQVYDESAVFA